MHKFYVGAIVPASIVFPMVAALASKRYWTSSHKVVLVFLIISAVVNTLASYLANKGINNLPLLHVYTVLEFAVATAFFYSVTERKTDRRIIVGLWIAFPLLSLYNVWRLNSIHLFNQLPRSVSAITILIFCISYLMRSLNFTAEKDPIFQFSVVVAWLLYFSGSLTLFALANFILDNKQLNMMLWDTHATFVMIMYFIIAIAYYKTGTEK
jgi:hypothetical protein